MPPPFSQNKGEGKQRKDKDGDHHEPKLLFDFSRKTMADKPLPKFGEWDVNDPSSAEGFTVIFNKARNEKKGGGQSDSPGKDEQPPGFNKNGHVLGKPSKKWFCCI
ncbi:BnaC03g44410D [Brassica napus]|uniref:(rape) hypothetical protein n=1 Tax=Brassica napus TaxID=3708 RepID=A0A078FKV7_BRANA|nr:protein NOI4 [Brassica napus]CAF1705853.1 unnamed protein product [Brassica napus]CDY15080.1 BnaC03g44410D [Brassica napus]